MPSIESWCTKWRIAINASKSQLLLIRRRYARKGFYGELKLFNEKIPLVTKAKYLGIVLNTSFKWND
ncbi:hypothetical protein X975_21365, partial [Stegodyphus mimosarum]